MIMRSAAHRQQDLVLANLIKPMVLAHHNILTFMWEQHHVATSAFERHTIRLHHTYDLASSVCSHPIVVVSDQEYLTVRQPSTITREVVGGHPN